MIGVRRVIEPDIAAPLELIGTVVVSGARHQDHCCILPQVGGQPGRLDPRSGLVIDRYRRIEVGQLDRSDAECVRGTRLKDWSDGDKSGEYQQ